MKKNKLLAFLSCAVICAVVCSAQAQNGPGRGRGGFGGRGFFAPQNPPGPPAPVPAEVTMARPTQAEVDKMNALLKSFIETSPEKEMLTKYASLLEVQVPRENSAIRPVQTRVRNDERHNGFVEIANNQEFDILFAGDSITDWWQRGAPQGGAEVQEKYFGNAKVANFAIAGDTTQGVLWGLQNGEGQGQEPKAIMLMIGTNNTGGNTGPEIAEGVGAVVHQMRTDFPDAKIMLLAIFPRGSGPEDDRRKKNEEANAIIAKLHDGEHVFFTNINDVFLDADGGLPTMPDNLHPNAEGYEAWAQAVAQTLKSWVQ